MRSRLRRILWRLRSQILTTMECLEDDREDPCARLAVALWAVDQLRQRRSGSTEAESSSGDVFDRVGAEFAIDPRELERQYLALRTEARSPARGDRD